MLRDRREAGVLLVEKLTRYRGADAVILALPRGGVVTAFEVARALALPLDIIAVRKIGHPFSPEYAVGVVDDRGTVMLNEAEAAALDPAWLKSEIERQKKEAQRRSALYRGGKKQLNVKRKTVILVDDGIATGYSMRLAVRSVKERGAERVVVAVPVAPAESLPDIQREGADEVIVLEPPEHFLGAVGAHYASFEQVEDEEVIRALETP